MSNINIPVLRHATVGVGGVTMDFTTVASMGAVYIINKGPGVVYFRFDNVVPPASFGNDRKQLAVNEIVNMEEILVTHLSFVDDGTGPSDVEVIALERGASGGIV